MLFVELIQGFAALGTLDLDDADAARELRVLGSHEREARVDEPCFEGSGELHHACFDLSRTDGVVEIHRGADGRETRVVTLAERFEFAGAFGVGIDVVTPSRSDHVRPNARDVRLFHIEHTRFFRPHEPLMRRSGIGVATDVAQIHIERSPALRAVEMDVDAFGVGRLDDLFRGKVDAAHVRDMRDRQHFGLFRERRDESVDELLGALRVLWCRNAFHGEPEARRPHVPCDVIRRVILTPEHDFVALFEGDTVIDGVVGLARVTHEGDLVGGDAELLRDLLPGGFTEPAEFCSIVERAIAVDIRGQLRHALRDRPRGRAQIGGVHRHFFLAERKLGADEMPISFAVERRFRERRRFTGFESDGQKGRRRGDFFEKGPARVHGSLLRSTERRS